MVLNIRGRFTKIFNKAPFRKRTDLPLAHSLLVNGESKYVSDFKSYILSS